ncbi:zinc finger protein 426-like [Centruroides vittatus]|uniref:zinc finger protein 426-like n=1 Tax=Centruroides vittatus TaxID=120091 RepID=UPI00350F0C0E
MTDCSSNNSVREESSDMKLFSRDSPKFKVLCPVCGSEYRNIPSVQMHLGSSSQPFTCGICGKGLNCEFNLNYHLKKHTCEKPYVCEICREGFHIFPALKVHLRGHLGDERYRCNLCDEHFVVGIDLKEHLMRHIGRKLYDFVCVCCGCSFARHSAFCRHKKWCDVKFKRELICRSRCADRPFVCEVCHIAFQSFKILKMHLEKHLGTKPYRCNLCEEQFSDGLDLRHHLVGHVTGRKYDSE